MQEDHFEEDWERKRSKLYSLSGKDTNESEQSVTYQKRKGKFCDDESSSSRNILSVGEKIRKKQ